MSVRRPRVIVSSTAAVFALIGACSDESSSFGISGGVVPPEAPTAIPPGGPKPGFVSACPDLTPSPGSPCQMPSTPPSMVKCEYGHDLDRECNDLFECDDRWQRMTRADCFGRCPATFEAIEAGAPCNDLTMGCSYLEGTCACVADDLDGGDPADGGAPPTGRWRCAPPPGGGCPAQRPPIGADCVRPMVCDYGSCILWRDLTFACQGRRWLQFDTTCADGGGR